MGCILVLNICNPVPTSPLAVLVSLQVHGISMIIECEGLSLFEVMKASTSEFARSNVIFDLVQVSALQLTAIGAEVMGGGGGRR